MTRALVSRLLRTTTGIAVRAIVVVIASGLVAAGTAFAATHATPPKGTSSISLPGDAGFAFKSGPGAATVQANCLTCHSSAYVSTQPVLTRAQWQAEVVKMKTVYGAPLADDQIPAIVDYLTTNYGKP